MKHCVKYLLVLCAISLNADSYKERIAKQLQEAHQAYLEKMEKNFDMSQSNEVTRCYARLERYKKENVTDIDFLYDINKHYRELRKSYCSNPRNQKFIEHLDNNLNIVEKELSRHSMFYWATGFFNFSSK